MSHTIRVLIGRMIQAPEASSRAPLTGAIAHPPATIREMIGRIIAPVAPARSLALDIPIVTPAEAPAAPAGTP